MCQGAAEASACMQVPSLAFNYCAYETLRSRWLCHTNSDTPTVRPLPAFQDSPASASASQFQRCHKAAAACSAVCPAFLISGLQTGF